MAKHYLYVYNFFLSHSIRIDNYLQHEEVAQFAVDAIYSVNQTVYRVGTSFEYLSLSSGVSKDFAASVGINLSFTCELPGGGVRGFDIEAERIPGVVEETFAGLTQFGSYVATYDWN